MPIHIAAGGLAMVLGAVARSVKQGGTIHRRSGLLFVCAMLVMDTSASILGFRKSPTDGNVFAGFMTAYSLGTALTTVRPVSWWPRGFNVAALTIALALAFLVIVGGVKAFNSARGVLNGVPFPMLFFIAGVTIVAAVGDVRIMRFGVPRLARHLCRRPSGTIRCHAPVARSDRSSLLIRVSGTMGASSILQPDRSRGGAHEKQCHRGNGVFGCDRSGACG